MFNQRGMSLISVIMAVGILGVVIASVMTTTNMALKAQRSSDI